AGNGGFARRKYDDWHQHPGGGLWLYWEGIDPPFMAKVREEGRISDLCKFVEINKPTHQRRVGLVIASDAPYLFFTSNRSRFITLVQAFTKSLMNFTCASALPYTSAMALNSELEPNTRSARLAVHLGWPVLRSVPR